MSDGEVGREEDAVAAVALDDEVAEGVAGGDVFGDVADDGELEPVVGGLLQDFAGETRSQLEEGSVETGGGDGDERRAVAHRFADQIARVVCIADDGSVRGGDEAAFVLDLD